MTYKRDWILPLWILAVEEACEQLGVIPSYMIVIDPRDQPSVSILENLSNQGREIYYQYVEEEPHEDVRVWNESRYHRMVYLRNLLLKGVRREEPSFFLSLDTDILLHPDALGSMFQSMQEHNFDALSTKTFMTKDGTSCPSFAMMPGLKRYDTSEILECDVIMAAKLMNIKAYSVDYKYHMWGEDIGWSENCKEAGLKLGFDGRTISRHVMSIDMLDRDDPRCV